MGFSLIFVLVNGNEQRDADRGAVASFLDERGLRAEGEELFEAAGRPLSFDGHYSDLHLDQLDQAEPLSGGIDHATLSDEESAFIYDLCITAGFLIVNPQGNPMYLVPGANHLPDEVPDPDDTVWVGSAGEMQQALAGNFADFREWRDRIISRD